MGRCKKIDSRKDSEKISLHRRPPSDIQRPGSSSLIFWLGWDPFTLFTSSNVLEAGCCTFDKEGPRDLDPAHKPVGLCGKDASKKCLTSACLEFLRLCHFCPDRFVLWSSCFLWISYKYMRCQSRLKAPCHTTERCLKSSQAAQRLRLRSNEELTMEISTVELLGKKSETS